MGCSMAFKNIPVRASIIIAIVATLLTLTTTGLLIANQTVPLTGTITTVNVGVYLDAEGTQNCTSLNFGSLNPGDTATQIVYIKNTGTAPVTLSMTANNWNPTSSSSYLTLSWNRQNTILNAQESIQATLTLTSTANADDLSSFGCDLTFTGTR